MRIEQLLTEVERRKKERDLTTNQKRDRYPALLNLCEDLAGRLRVAMAALENAAFSPAVEDARRFHLKLSEGSVVSEALGELCNCGHVETEHYTYTNNGVETPRCRRCDPDNQPPRTEEDQVAQEFGQIVEGSDFHKRQEAADHAFEVVK